MITNQTIDGVPRKLLSSLLAWLERANERNDDGDIAEYVELRALLDAPAENVIDVSASDWAAIQEAAIESTWMPPEYMRNDWVDDVCRFLREGAAAQLGAEGFYQLIEDSDLKTIQEFLGDGDLPTKSFFSRPDAAYLANVSMHLVREVQALRIKVAAQPQGEPVAWLVQWNSILPGITGHREVVLVEPFFSPGAATVTTLCACLNSTRPAHANTPPGTEPFGTHPHNDGLDEYRVLGLKVVEDASVPPGQIRMCDCNQGRLPCRCLPIPAGIESLAQQIYQSWESQPGFAPWVDGGSSTKQNEARQIASRTFELALASQVEDLP